jgi:hypothetical protein
VIRTLNVRVIPSPLSPTHAAAHQPVLPLRPSALHTNIVILETAHSTLSLWRAQTRFDAPYAPINMGVSELLLPFAPLFPFTIARLFPDLPPPTAEPVHVIQSIALLVELI